MKRNDNASPVHPSSGFWRSVWRRFRSHYLGMFGLAVVGLLCFTGLFAPVLAYDDPIVCRYEGRIYFPGIKATLQNIPFGARLFPMPVPFRYPSFEFKKSYDPERDWALWAPIPFGPTEIVATPLMAPSRTHWLGTDESGRDVLSRMIHGAGISMKVGFVSMGIALTLGIILGSIAGYAGGWPDLIISRFIEMVMCFPVFFLILAILAWLPPKIEYVMIVIGLTRWVGIARYTRAEILRLRQIDFVHAVRMLGAGPVRIVFRHLLPNSMAPIMVSVTFGFAAAILIEAALSWLGFGVQAPQPSWGNILRAGYDSIFTAPHMVPAACFAIFITVLSFNLVGDALRDVIDPRLQGSESVRSPISR